MLGAPVGRVSGPMGILVGRGPAAGIFYPLNPNGTTKSSSVETSEALGDPLAWTISSGGTD
ncbi:MAG: hypothetical protein AMXMBFR20_32430 [Planctomycetia bacterium]